jgi:esterase/lipase superfamily enzyme
MNSSYQVLSHSYASPEEQVLFASSVDTEGELRASSRPVNRTITMTVEMIDATGSLARALQAKIAKIRREGGTLKRTAHDRP